MDLKAKVSHLTKSQIQTGLIVASLLAGATYFSIGGSVSGMLSMISHPFDKHARQVQMEVGYSNKALASQVKEGHQYLSTTGLKTPTPIKIGTWGPEDQEVDEYDVVQIVDGLPIPINRVLSERATKIVIKANLVGRDGCGDFKIKHLLPDDSFNEKESKICLAQDEVFEIPVSKSDYLIKKEAEIAKRNAERLKRDAERERKRKLRRY
jgi:hypothetical protein